MPCSPSRLAFNQRCCRLKPGVDAALQLPAPRPIAVPVAPESPKLTLSSAQVHRLEQGMNCMQALARAASRAHQVSAIWSVMFGLSRLF